jgi:hypothetical protein
MSTISNAPNAYLLWGPNPSTGNNEWQYSVDNTNYQPLSTDNTLEDAYDSGDQAPSTIMLWIENGTTTTFVITVSGDTVTPTGPQSVSPDRGVAFTCTLPTSSPGGWTITPDTPADISSMPTDPTFNVTWSRKKGPTSPS